jgi:hypothetical protein
MALGTLPGLAAVTGAGCGSNDVPHGPPVLLAAYWDMLGAGASASCVAPTSDAGGDGATFDAGSGLPASQCLIWTKDDPTRTAIVPPAANQFNLVFDRVLDGSKIEDTVTDAGVTRQFPKLSTDDAGLNLSPVTVVVGDGTTPPPPSAFSLVVWYNSVSLPFAASGSSYVYGRARSDNLPADAPSPTLTFPTRTLVTINLDQTRITSKYNEPMIGPTSLSVLTAPFSLAIALPRRAGGGTVSYAPINYWIPLEFNNRLGDLKNDVAPHIQVRQDGRLLRAEEYGLVLDPALPTRILVRPLNVQATAPAPGDLSTNPVWGDGARIEVTVDATLPDVYGAPLSAAATASFIAGTPGDGGSVADGGPAADAGVDAATSGDDAGSDGVADAPADAQATDDAADAAAPGDATAGDAATD